MLANACKRLHSVVSNLVWVMSQGYDLSSFGSFGFSNINDSIRFDKSQRYPSYSQRSSPSSGGFFGKSFRENTQSIWGPSPSVHLQLCRVWMSWSSKSKFQNWTAKSEGYPRRTFATTCDFETFDENEGSQNVAKYSFWLIHRDLISSL